MFLLSVAIVLALCAGEIFLWHYRTAYDGLVLRQREVLARLTSQKGEALRLRERVRRLDEEARRIRAFDAKLTVMIDAPRDTGAGGTGAPSPVDRLPGEVFGDDLGRRLFDFLGALGNRMAVEEAMQQDLARLLDARKLEFLTKPSLWPTRGYITSTFGSRPSPFGRGGDFHNGVDIKVPIGSPVFAAGAGRVTDVGYMNGYGLRVVVSHDFGLETVYAHLQKAEVKPGQAVKRGERIALSGNSGRTTGAHLHYEVRVDGTPVNPRQYLLD